MSQHSLKPQAIFQSHMSVASSAGWTAETRAEADPGSQMMRFDHQRLDLAIQLTT